MLCSLLTRVISFIYYFVAGGFLGSDISFSLAVRPLRPERAGDSDCCLSSIIRSVTWRRLSTQKGNGNCGCHIAGFLLGLSQSGKPRTSVVGPYQIQIAVDRTGRFHGLVASASDHSRMPR